MVDLEADRDLQSIVRSLPLDFADVAFRGLLGREGDASGLATYCGALASSGDLASVLRAMSSSDEHWRRQICLRAATVVQDVFVGLLGREADPRALAQYTDHLRRGWDLRRFLDVLAKSAEMRRRVNSLHRNSGRPPEHPTSRWAHHAEHVDHLFSRFVGRSPSGDEFAHCLHEPAAVGPRVRLLLQRLSVLPFPPQRPPRVLLFGAFGNGNIGDAYQALAVRHHLAAAWGLDDEAFHACSLLSTSDYPFPGDRKLSALTILDPDAVNQFDVLVIGGGGLLAHPHHPLTSWDWLKKLHLPVVVLAIGASEELVGEHRDLLSRAWSVSGRDSVSVRALQRLRSDAFLLRDPILSCTDPSMLCVCDQAPASDTSIDAAASVLWVLKYPSSAADRTFLDRIAQFVALNPSSHRIVAVEPIRDQVLSEWFDGSVHFVVNLAQLSGYIKTADVVVSMRYHGSIFAAMHGRASVSFSQPKIAHLYREFDLTGEYVTHPDQLLPALRHHICAPVEPLSRERKFERAVRESDLAFWCRPVHAPLSERDSPQGLI